MTTQIAESVFKEFNDSSCDSIVIHRNDEKLVVEMKADGIIYFLKGEKQKDHFMEILHSFIKEMSYFGVPFSKLENTINGSGSVKRADMIFTCEKKASGQEIEKLQMSHIIEIGKMLGKQHAVSEKSSIRFGTGTSWGMFGGNETDLLGDYDENELTFNDFLYEVGNLEAFENESELIKYNYFKKRDRLRAVWDMLPLGAVQGDFCPYNMFFNKGKITCIFDFNVAGDEIFLNECIGVGVFVSWHHPYEGPELEQERFTEFIKAYKGQRKMTELEVDVFDDLFAIIRAFRYDRIESGLEMLQDKDQAQKFVRETLDLLSCSKGIIDK